MDYRIKDDLTLIREFFNFTQDDFSKILDVDRTTLARIENGVSYPRIELIDKIYNYCFKKGLRLNIQKEMLYKDDIKNDHILLVHASKTGLEGELTTNKARINNDFGQGFYCGDSYEKSVSFVCRFKDSSAYFIDFNPNNLKMIKFEVDTKWMLIIAYFRGRLDDYKDSKIIEEIIESLKEVDYIIAPIADNRMFQIIDTFIEGEITDEQCKHSLAATNLGYQYVFLTQNALNNLKILERCFISSLEKEHYKKEQVNFQKIGQDKSKLARIQYKGKGKYIEEILV